MKNVTFTDDEIHNLKLALLDAIGTAQFEKANSKVVGNKIYWDNRINSYRSVLDKIGY